MNKRIGRPRKDVRKEEEGQRISAVLSREARDGLHRIRTASGMNTTQALEAAIGDYARRYPVRKEA